MDANFYIYIFLFLFCLFAPIMHSACYADAVCLNKNVSVVHCILTTTTTISAAAPAAATTKKMRQQQQQKGLKIASRSNLMWSFCMLCRCEDWMRITNNKRNNNNIEIGERIFETFYMHINNYSDIWLAAGIFFSPPLVTSMIYVLCVCVCLFSYVITKNRSSKFSWICSIKHVACIWHIHMSIAYPKKEKNVQNVLISIFDLKYSK